MSHYIGLNLNSIIAYGNQYVSNETVTTKVTPTTVVVVEMPCRRIIEHGQCKLKDSNLTQIKLFLKYKKLLKKYRLPAIPCDDNLDEYFGKDKYNTALDLDVQIRNNSKNGTYFNDSLKLNSVTEMFEPPNFMYLQNAIGRIGNQLFQFAAVLGLACYHGYEPIISPMIGLTQSFDLPFVQNKDVVNVKPFSLYHPWGTFAHESLMLDHKSNWSFEGYFQSFKYFVRSSEVLRRSLVIKQQYLISAYTFVKNVSREGFQNVCVHLRRGDLLHIPLGYATVEMNFITKAMTFYRNIYKLVNFIVLSDDMSWCRANLKDDVVYSPFQDSASDMALMMLCDHVVVTSGTFGWWGAWLSGGTTVYFSGFIKNGSKLSKGYKMEDYYPPNWIPIS